MSARTGRIKVLIVDDSAVVRQVLATRLRASADIEVIGTVSDPVFAMEHMNREWPDVVVLDIEMPRMDGLTFLKKIMDLRPTPVVICSTLTRRGAETTLEALAAGAAAVIAKPESGLKKFLEDESADIVAAVRAAAATNASRLRRPAAVPAYTAAPPASRTATTPVVRDTDRIVAMGTSTGGTQALEVVLPRLAPGCPGVVLVQHMPAKFTAAFAERLDAMCRVRVREARDGDPVLPGQVLVAPGGRHMELRRPDTYRVRVFDGPPVNRHCPSVDVLFRSVAKVAGRNAVGVIMTGMGDDGARGLLEMRRAGAFTVAQDEATCVVHGMPREAVALGAVDRESPLGSIAEVIHHHG
ncbi:chemotaxis response regulator protein-glutamate methylesterase [Actinoplanes sp. NPDC049548]|uniref:protein-glutamate methylesterase/protein-glutamine glutaminase n=1 Tax=Actinoplanes sp. NPDC049548 TaxID=3155152 RepID=UPI003444E07F